MHRCLELAKLGFGNVAPNPMVGAVLVYNDAIIGEGYHQQYGQPHSEVNFINSVLEENKVGLQEFLQNLNTHFSVTYQVEQLENKN